MVELEIKVAVFDPVLFVFRSQQISQPREDLLLGAQPLLEVRPLRLALICTKRSSITMDRT
ncbi:hypothetical protein [Pseudomonas sp. NPDC088890]|uniref:hypothetical protein n=1 Tax=Pseudomonas sp. NPDC088890 TaxID=3364458 RepID=UPI00384A4C3E